MQKIFTKDPDEWNKQDILEYLYSLNAVEFYGWKQIMMLPKHIKDDMIAEVWLKICEISEEKLVKLLHQSEKNLTAYIRQFIIFQLTPTGGTRKLRQMLTSEIITDFNEAEKIYNKENE